MQRADSLEKTLMLGKIEGRRRREWQRMRRLDGITNSLDMSLRKLRKMVQNREYWHTAVHGVAKSLTWLSNCTATCKIKCSEFFTLLTDYSVHLSSEIRKAGLHQSKTTSVQFSSVAQSCPTLCDPMNRSTPGLPVHHQLPEFTQTHAHQIGDAIQPSHPLSSPSPPAPNPSQHQGLFQWVNSSHEVAKILEFQLPHQSFQWTPRTDLL